MNGWGGFALAFAGFMVSHSVPVRPAVKARLVAVLGRAGFGMAYGLLSVAALAWLIVAAGRAPFVEVWGRYEWQTHATLSLMLVVCLLGAAAVGRPNPFSFGGARNAAFDPARPGPVRWTRHPMLVVLALWAGAHLLPNGDLAHVILFGALGGFALFGMKMIDRRKRREMGAEWEALWAAVKAGPLVPRPASWGGFALRMVLGVAVYGLLIWLHPIVIGVSPLP